MKTFICEFGKGITCTMHTTDFPVKSLAQSHIISVHWTKKLPKKLFPQFVLWMNAVHEQLSVDWNHTFTQAYQIENGPIDIWVFEPGKPAKKQGTVGLGCVGE